MDKYLKPQPWKAPVSIFDHFADQNWALFFDSADTSHGLSNISYILIDPVETQTNFDGGFEHLSERYKERFKDTHLPYFCGGWAGYFGYDLAFHLENLPKQDSKSHPDCPDIALGFYKKGYVFDHRQQKAYSFGDVPNLDTFETKEQADYHPPQIAFKSNFSAQDYKRGVEKIIDYICAGDIFQANFSHCLSTARPKGFTPWQHYKHLRQLSPAPYAGYFHVDGLHYLSSSPEQFLSLNDGIVETRPIKGTLSKKENPEVLLRSEKDRAENMMIVDLLRNDLAKTCEDDSIKEPKLCALEEFSHVYHLVSTVIGKLQKDKTPFDLIKGCFPGGSITGAPKVRAMEIIEELETVHRGPYCGSFAMIGVNGVMQSNIAIRTLFVNKETIWFNVGGAVVSDSNPKAEYEETWAKAEGILKSFSA